MPVNDTPRSPSKLIRDLEGFRIPEPEGNDLWKIGKDGELVPVEIEEHMPKPPREDMPVKNDDQMRE